MDFGEKIKKYREDNHLTQEDIATKLCVTRQTVSKWELGNCYPNYDLLLEISKLLEESVDNLISKKEIVTEAINFNSKKKRNRIVLISSLSVALVGISISVISLLTANNAKQIALEANTSDAEPEIIPDKKCLGALVKDCLTSSLDFENNYPKVEEWRSKKYPGIYFEDCSIHNGKRDYTVNTVGYNHSQPTIVKGLNSFVFKICINADYYNLIDFGNYYFPIYTVWEVADQIEFELVSPVVSYEHHNNSYLNIGFEAEEFGKYAETKEFEFDFTFAKQSEQIVIKEYDDSFNVIKTTTLDNLDELTIEIGNEFIVSKEALFIIVEDGNNEQMIWNDDFSSTPYLIKHSDKPYFSNVLSFKKTL